MSLNKSISILDKLDLKNRYKQFGLFETLKQFLQFFTQVVYQSDTQLVLLVKPVPEARIDNQIIKITTLEKLNWLEENFKLSKQIALSKLESLISKENDVFVYNLDGVIVGYAAVQYSGVYRFGLFGLLNVPKGLAIFNNLFVDSNCRGKSIAKRLNEARINEINNTLVYCVFVMKTNRSALKNWERLGYPIAVEIKQVRLFRKYKNYFISNQNSNLPELQNFIANYIDKR